MRQTTSASLLLGLLMAGGTAAADTLERISVSSGGEQANEESFAPLISADGKTVAFASRASNLVDGDTNGAIDVFVRDRTTGKTERVSLSSTDEQANGYSNSPSISADGRYVAFVSSASNLVAGDANEREDIFVRDRLAGTTTLASVLPDGGQMPAGSDSLDAVISANGRFVVFRRGFNFTPRISAGQVYVRDLLLGATTPVPSDILQPIQNPDNAGIPTFWDIPPLGSVADDGRHILLTTRTPLAAEDGNATGDVYLYDLGSTTAERVNLTFDGQEAWPWVADHFYYGLYKLGATGSALMSADQSSVAFTSYSSNLVPYDYNGQPDIFVRDRAKNTLERVNISAMGEEAAGDISNLTGLSSDGRIVVFKSYAENLVHDDGNQLPDIFMHDRKTRHTWRVSQSIGGIEGNGDSDLGVLSGTGQALAFSSKASNLVDNDTNGVADIFVREMPTVPPTADLAISQASKLIGDDPGTATELEYTATVTNKGDTPATNAGFTVEFHKSFVPVSRDAGCEPTLIGTAGPYRVTCRIGNLASGASVSKHFQLTQTKNGYFQAHGQAWADQFDPNGQDNTNTLVDSSVNLLPTGDLAVTVKPNIKKAAVGKKIQYKVTINNLGSVRADEVHLSQYFSLPVQFVAIPKACRLELENTLTCGFGALKAHRQTSVVLAVKPQQKGALRTTSNIWATMKEVGYGNNMMEAEITVN